MCLVTTGPLSQEAVTTRPPASLDAATAQDAGATGRFAEEDAR